MGIHVRVEKISQQVAVTFTLEEHGIALLSSLYLKSDLSSLNLCHYLCEHYYLLLSLKIVQNWALVWCV